MIDEQTLSDLLISDISKDDFAKKLSETVSSEVVFSTLEIAGALLEPRMELLEMVAQKASVLPDTEDKLKEIFSSYAWEGWHEPLSFLINHKDAKYWASEGLRKAAEKGHLECTRVLLQKADPKEEESYALRWAAANGHLECVRLLLPVSDASGNKSLALYWAAGRGYTEIVRELIPHSNIHEARERLEHDRWTSGLELLKSLEQEFELKKKFNSPILQKKTLNSL